MQESDVTTPAGARAVDKGEGTPSIATNDQDEPFSRAQRAAEFQTEREDWLEANVCCKRYHLVQSDRRFHSWRRRSWKRPDRTLREGIHVRYPGPGA